MRNSRAILKISIRYFSSILLLLNASACSAFLVQKWDGFTDWTFKVSVYDQATISPVPNAEVSIIVKNEDSFGDIESFIKEKEPKKCTTNSEGMCDLTMKFNTYGNRSVWKSDKYVNFRHRNLFVQAKGYQPLNLPLKAFIQTPHKLSLEGENVKLSEIKIKMSRIETN